MSTIETQELRRKIDECFSDIHDSKQALKAFHDLANIIDFGKAQLTMEDILDILYNHSGINAGLKLIVNNNIDLIKAGKADQLCNNGIFALLLSDYCVKNNIEINKPNDMGYFSDESVSDMSSTTIYLNEINQIPLLSEAEEVELGLKLLAGDQAAKKKLIEANLRWVVRIAKYFVGRGLDFGDLIQEGNAGLIKAADRFNVEKGYRFSTYSRWWIMQSISRAVTNNSRSIRIPVHRYSQMRQFLMAREELRASLNREPSNAEICNLLNISEIEGEKLLQNFSDVVSLQTQVGNEEDAELGDFIASDDEGPEEIALKSVRRDELKSLLQKSGLNYREQLVIILRFGIGQERELTLEETGLKLCITRERVRQIETKALRKIREAARNMDKANRKLKKDEVVQLIKSKKIFDYYRNVPREKIVSSLRRLSKRDLYYVCRRFSTDYIYKNLTNDEKIATYNAINRLQSLIYNSKDIANAKNAIDSIFEYYNEYSAEEINCVANSLSNAERRVVNHRFKGTYKVMPYSHPLNFNNGDLFHAVDLKIRKRLKLLRSITSCNSIYDYYNNYSKKDVDAEINKIATCEDKSFICEVFSNKRIITPEDLDLAYYILNRMERTLYKPQMDSIYKYLPYYGKKNIDLALKKLSIEEKNLIEKKFSVDLDSPKEQELFIQLVQKIKFITEEMSEEKRYRYQSLYFYFKNFNKSSVDAALKTLSEEEITVLKEAYGENLNNRIDPDEDLDEKQLFVIKTLIIPKIKKRLKNDQTLFEYYSSYSKEDIECAISLLSKEDAEFLKVRFGSDYNSPSYDPEIKTQFGATLSRKIKKLLNNLSQEEVNYNSLKKRITKEDIINAKAVVETEEFREVFGEYCLRDRIMFFLKYNLASSKELSITALADFFCTKNEEILSVFNDMLNHYAEVLSEGKSNCYVDQITRCLKKKEL